MEKLPETIDLTKVPETIDLTEDAETIDLTNEPEPMAIDEPEVVVEVAVEENSGDEESSFFYRSDSDYESDSQDSYEYPGCPNCNDKGLIWANGHATFCRYGGCRALFAV